MDGKQPATSDYSPNSAEDAGSCPAEEPEAPRAGTWPKALLAAVAPCLKLAAKALGLEPKGEGTNVPVAVSHKQYTELATIWAG